MNSSSTTTAVEVRRTALLMRCLRFAAVTAIAVLGPVGLAVVETAGIYHP
jgi:hypothetical protein